MRILLVTPFLPDRGAAHGGGAYLAGLGEALRQRAELGLAALVDPAEAARLAAGGHGFAWIGTAPRPDRPAGRGRWRHQLRMLWRWRHLPLVAAKHWQPAFPAVLAAARQQWRPDAVLVELAQMAQYLPHLAGLPTVLTDHEAGCPANTATGLGRAGDARDRRLWHRYVAAFYPRATLLQAVTREDAQALAERLGRPVEVRGPVCAVPAAPVAPAQAPPRALFLGDYQHQPNPEAAAVLATQVLPRLREVLPAAELWLAGPHAERLGALGQRPGVRVVGFAPDLGALFGSVRLLLAPVFSGGGFRMKALTALAHGLPVVTNALGARGIAAPAAALRRAEDPAGLAAAALAWLGDPAAAGAAGAAAHAWAQQHLDAGAVAAAQLARLAALPAGGSAG